MIFTLLDLAGKTFIQFPVPPQEIQAQIGPVTKTFTPLDIGDVELPRGRQPVRITWSGLLPGPGRKLPDQIVKVKPDDVVKKIKDWSNKAQPPRLRLLVTGSSAWNMWAFISAFDPVQSGGHGDIEYSITLTEWRDLTVNVVAKKPAPKRPAPPKPKTHTVKKGDTLWGIAKKYYGKGSLWPKIHKANKSKIKNPNLIYPGQKFVIP